MKTKFTTYNVLDTLIMLDKKKVREVYENWKYGGNLFMNYKFPDPISSTFLHIFTTLNKTYLDSIIEE